MEFDSSTRSIKRKKFDDELVESSLNMGGSLATLPVRSSRTRYSISGKNFSNHQVMLKIHQDSLMFSQRKGLHPAQQLYQQAA